MVFAESFCSILVFRTPNNVPLIQGTVKEMDKTPKKLCNQNVKIWHYCNSHLSNLYDSIHVDLFQKTAKRGHVIEKLKEVRKIDVQDSNEEFPNNKNLQEMFFRRSQDLQKQSMTSETFVHIQKKSR